MLVCTLRSQPTIVKSTLTCKPIHVDLCRWFYFRLWPVSTVAQQPELGNQRDEYGYDYYIKLRSEREMKVRAGIFVTRGILLLIFVSNRILLVSILSPTISSISHVNSMRLNLSVFLSTSFTTIYFVIFTSLTNL